MKLKASVSHRSWVVLLTLVIIGFIFGTYFFAYIPTKEDQLIQEKFRALELLGKNISDRYFDKLKFDQINSASDLSVIKDQPRDSVRIDSLLLDVIEEQTTRRVTSQVFDEIFIIKNKKLFHQSVGHQLQIDQVDSLLHISSGVKSTNTFQIKIANVEYVTFISQFRLDNQISGAQSIYLAGLTNLSNFQKQTRQIKSWILINAAFILLIVLMSMPWSKLIFMSPIERLYRSNVIWLGISLILGLGLLVLISISAYTFLQSRNQVDIMLEDLAEEVKEKFVNEINKRYDQLVHFDTLHWSFSNSALGEVQLNPSQSQGNNIPVRFGSDTMLLVSDVLSSPIVARSQDGNIYFSNLFWVNKYGQLRVRFSTHPQSESDIIRPISIQERSYFKNIVSGDGWYMPGHPSKDQKFALQSIKSWADGTYVAGLSKISQATLKAIDEIGKEAEMAIIAMSTRLSSVTDPILLPGYALSIIGQDGQVWFHSDKEKNLQENLFAEIQPNKAVDAAIIGRMARTTNLVYKDEGYRARIIPIDNTPLYLITTYDKIYSELPIIQTLSLSCFYLLLLYAIIGVLILYLFIVKHVNTKLKRKRFLLDWLMPRESATEKFALLAWTNMAVLGLIAVLALCFYIPSLFNNLLYSLAPLFLILLTPVYVFVFAYLKLSNDPRRAKIILTITYIVLLITPLNAMYFQFGGQQYLVFLFQAALCVLLWYMWKKDRIHLILQKPFFARTPPYALFLTSSAVLISIVPVFYSYKSANALEKMIWTKYAQIKAAQNIHDRNEEIEDIYGKLIQVEEDSISNKRKYLSQMQQEGLSYINLNCYITPITQNAFDSIGMDTMRVTSATSNESLEVKKRAPSMIEALIFHIRPDYHPLITETKAYGSSTSNDSLWRWKHPFRDNLLALEYRPPNATPIHFRSDLNPLKKLSSDGNRWLLGILVLLSMALAFYIVRFAIKRIFAEAFQNYAPLGEIIPGFLKDPTNNRIFLTQVASAARGNTLANYLKDLDHKNYFPINLSSVDPEDPLASLKDIKDEKVIVVDDFEYLINNHEYWQAKLKLLEEIGRDSKRQIIISSEIHPLVVVKFYEVMIEKIYDKQWDEKLRAEYQSYRHAKSQWQKFYSGYVTLYAPLQNEDIKATHNLDKYPNQDIGRLVNNELCRGIHLRKLEPLIQQYYESIGPQIDPEDIILKIQSLAESYYYAIWSSLDKDEKFLVFDLAKDGFVNVKNSATIRILLQKGLVRHEDNLKLMNDSFNNFILTVVDREMEWAMQKEMHKKGTWSTLQTVLVIVAISIIIFITLGQQQLLDNFKASLTAIIAVGGLLIRFGGILSVFTGKKEAK